MILISPNLSAPPGIHCRNYLLRMYPDNNRAILTAATGKSASPEVVEKRAGTTGLKSAKRRRKKPLLKKETLALEKGPGPSHPLTKPDNWETMGAYKSFICIIISLDAFLNDLSGKR